MAKVKLLHWVIAAKETGRYGSFTDRQWPTAFYGKGGPFGAAIECKDAYTMGRATGQSVHAPLRVLIHNHATNKRHYLKQHFATLLEAKDAATRFLTQNPDWQPKGVAK